MHIVFLDEFGHIGPFVSRTHERYKTSPVFGLGGFCLPQEEVRGFGNWFFKLKLDAFKGDIEASDKHPSAWEKKGNTIFTHGKVYKTKRLGYSLINKIKSSGGKILYNGIEKYQDSEKSNPDGLYSTILSHGIRKFDRYFVSRDSNYLVILDEHQNRMRMLEGALKTMWGNPPVRNLIEPPYQVESHLYQTIQAADWLCSIVGALWAYRAQPMQFPDREWAEKYFGTRIASATTHSSVILRRPAKQLPLRPT